MVSFVAVPARIRKKLVGPPGDLESVLQERVNSISKRAGEVGVVGGQAASS